MHDRAGPGMEGGRPLGRRLLLQKLPLCVAAAAAVLSLEATGAAAASASIRSRRDSQLLVHEHPHEEEAETAVSPEEHMKGIMDAYDAIKTGRLVPAKSFVEYDKFLREAHAKEEREKWEFKCEKTPSLCQAPFNCDVDPPQRYEMLLWNTASVASPDDNINLRGWCVNHAVFGNASNSFIQNLYHEHNMPAASKARYEVMIQEGSELYYSYYCSTQGHCTNPSVSNDTDLANSIRMCDGLYGRQGWTSISLRGPKVEEWDVKRIGKISCAIGHFHADAAFCNDYVCRNPEVKAEVDAKVKEALEIERQKKEKAARR